MSENAVLSAAIGAAMTVIGWRAVRVHSEARLPDTSYRNDAVSRLVLVADARGRLPDPRPASDGRFRPFVVAVGTRSSWSALSRSMERRVADAAVDADQPFPDLIQSLDRLLRAASSPPDRASLLAALREREQEARRFTDLTRREQQVLGAMVVGRSAAEIATKDQVSMTTVRSHIRAVLTKIGVSSQLAAVALTHRSCGEQTVVEQMRRFHQF